jgi:2-keto-4-pentenoate hydratase
MYFELIDTTADRLADSRRHDTPCDLPLDRIVTEAEAVEIQNAALDSLGFERKGYAIIGSSQASRRTLGLTSPVFSPVPAFAYHPSGTTLRLPFGTIGAQCEIAFTILRCYPDRGEAMDRTSAADAIMTCQPSIGILGHRTSNRHFGDYPAIADFGLHVATITGDHVGVNGIHDLAKLHVDAFLFKNKAVHGSTDSIFGHPLDAVAWLAAQLSARGHRLEAGDIVTTGSCTTILQVLPGEHMAAAFETLGQVECIFR